MKRSAANGTAGRAGLIGLRIRHKGKVTDLYINQLADGRLMHSNSWIMPDGWMTDAYMFAVSLS